MKISLQELHDMNACKRGIARFQLQTNGTLEPVDVATLVGGPNTYADLLWLAGETFSEQRIIRFACDCALINIELIKPYTDEYDLIVNWLNNPTEQTAANPYEAARKAAAGAYDATCAARAARAAYTAVDTACGGYVAYAAVDVALIAADIDQAKVDALLVQLFNEVD